MFIFPPLVCYESLRMFVPARLISVLPASKGYDQNDQIMPGCATETQVLEAGISVAIVSWHGPARSSPFETGSVPGVRERGSRRIQSERNEIGTLAWR